MRTHLQSSLALSFLLAIAPLTAQSPQGLNLADLTSPAKEGKVEVSNRIVARVNGKPISLLDVIKKMDIVFYRQFPEYKDDIKARYEFYASGWMHALDDIISKELVLADAEEKKMPLSQGDIREEMESSFGPNIMLSLEDLGLTFEEARSMVAEEITMRRMLWFRVNSQAVAAVGPARVRQTFEEIAAEQKGAYEWRYRVVSLRGNDEDALKQAADECYETLSAHQGELDEITSLLQPLEEKVEGIKLSVSTEFHNTAQSISEAHREGIKGLSAGEVGAPLAQTSRSANERLYRIYILKEEIEPQELVFEEVEPKIREGLTNQEMMKGHEEYMNELHKHYEVEMLISDTVPATDLFSIY